VRGPSGEVAGVLGGEHRSELLPSPGALAGVAVYQGLRTPLPTENPGRHVYVPLTVNLASRVRPSSYVVGLDCMVTGRLGGGRPATGLWEKKRTKGERTTCVAERGDPVKGEEL